MPRGPWGSAGRIAARSSQRTSAGRRSPGRSRSPTVGKCAAQLTKALGLGAAQTKHSVAGQVKLAGDTVWQRDGEGSVTEMGEARLVESDAGSAPAEEGWFVLNVGDAAWFTSSAFGSATRFESPEAHFAQ